MRQKSVFILEDREAQRLALKTGLASYGLETIVAKDLSEARVVLAKHGDVDVVLLDVEIEVEGGLENGLEFGLELKNARREWPPEFLVYSVKDKPDYYEQALALGAAGYLRKGKVTPEVEVLVQHVRALALRRALHSERPGMTERLRGIAESSRSRDEAIERFCRDVLIKEISETFGDSFVLLVSHAGRARWFSKTIPEPPYEVITRIEAAVHGRLTETEPLLVNSSEIIRDLSLTDRSANLVESLALMDGAAFTSLAEAKNVRLALGLPPDPYQEESMRNQARVLDRYLQREVIANLFRITEIWAELELKRKLEAQKRQVLLTATSQFCLYQGQEILSVLFEAQRGSGNKEGLIPVTRLRAIATEIRNAGETLMEFALPDESNPRPVGLRVEMQRLVENAWSVEAPRLRLAQQKVLRLDGECSTSDREDRAAKAVSQILGWMGRRLVRFGDNEAELALIVSCVPPNSGKIVKVVFEERRSRRLSPQLRKTFFEPFYAQGAATATADLADSDRRLGLYLARTLAQIAGGDLSDHSDDMAGPLGHRLVLELPAAVNA